MAKNEARNNLMAARTANRKARKDAKAKLTEMINAAYAEYRKLVADLKAEREAISKAAKPTGRKTYFDGRTMCYFDDTLADGAGYTH